MRLHNLPMAENLALVQRSELPPAVSTLVVLSESTN